jgi:hypothetical protein
MSDTRVPSGELQASVPKRLDAVDVSTDDEVTYWTRVLHCSEPMLRFAVRRAGISVAGVTDYLSTRRCM